MGLCCDSTRVSGDSSVGGASYGYDLVGNRKDQPADSVAPGNRLRRWKTFRMSYDADGNLQVKRTLNPTDTLLTLEIDSLFWSALGLLDSVHIADSAGTAKQLVYRYDGWGRRVRSSFHMFGQSTFRYLWDGDNLIFRLDSLGNRNSYWTFFPGSPRPQSMGYAGDTTLYYVADAQHNTVAILRSTGGGGYTPYNQMRYEPFGKRTVLTGPQSAAYWYGFKGAFFDVDTRFYLMGARNYDPDVGRFISEDPAGLQAGINLYAFAGNDPLTGYDPSGEVNLRDLLRWAPAVAFVAMVAAGGFTSAAILAASKTMASTALGAALSAGVQSALSGDPFLTTFENTFGVASVWLTASVGIALASGGIQSIRPNTILQGTIVSKNPVLGGSGGGLTLGGTSAAIYGVPYGGTLAHELGHTLQFVALSALGRLSPLAPFLTFWGLGGLEALDEKGWWQNLIGHAFASNARWLGWTVGSYIPQW